MSPLIYSNNHYWLFFMGHTYSYSRFDPIDREELLRTQKELALNYTVGKNMLYIGFFGFICSAICLLLNKIKTLKNKFNRS